MTLLPIMPKLIEVKKREVAPKTLKKKLGLKTEHGERERETERNITINLVNPKARIYKVQPQK